MGDGVEREGEVWGPAGLGIEVGSVPHSLVLRP